MIEKELAKEGKEVVCKGERKSLNLQLFLMSVLPTFLTSL